MENNNKINSKEEQNNNEEGTPEEAEENEILDDDYLLQLHQYLQEMKKQIGKINIQKWKNYSEKKMKNVKIKY